MKTLFSLSALLVIALISNGCKKDGDHTTDSVNAISGKTWTGTLTNPADSTEYYNVHFTEDNKATWNQMSGEYTGTWSLISNHLSVNFTSPAVLLTADIINGNKMTNIKTNNSSIVNSGELLTNSGSQNLDGTKWRGVMTDRIGSTYTMGAEFKSGNKLTIGLDGLTAETFTYVRSADGISIRAVGGSEVWFGLLLSDNKITGTWDKAENKWEATKQ